MPYQIVKIPNKSLFKVINKDNGKVHSNGTTLRRAEKQVRLLEYLDSGKKNKIKKI